MKSLLESRFAFLFVSIMLAATPLLFAQNKSMGPTELELQKLLQDAAFKNGEVAFLAINLDNGRVITEHNSQKSMIPASIQKLITTGVALETLGKEYQFSTSFFHTGSIKDGVLSGNLIIMPKGDPTFGSERFGKTSAEFLASIKTQLTEKGIKSIDGKIIIDMDNYNRYNTPRGMLWEDMGNYFGASPTSLMWKENMVSINLRSAQSGVPAMLADKFPSEAYPFEIDLDITAADDNRDNAWFFSAPYSRMVYGKGTIPQRRSSFPVKISNPNPAYTFGVEFKSALGWNETEVVMNYDKITYESQPIFTLNSVSLSKIISVTNMHSVNLFADALCTTLDTSKSDKSIEGGLAHIESKLKAMNVNSRGIRMLDGSGISPMNRVTAQTMTDFLGAMYRSQNFDAFFASLPVAGQSGTIKSYFGGTKAEGNLRAKSGTMAGTRNYAGYVTNKYQENIAFCLIMNDYDEDRKSIVMERITLLLNALIED